LCVLLYFSPLSFAARWSVCLQADTCDFVPGAWVLIAAVVACIYVVSSVFTPRNSTSSHRVPGIEILVSRNKILEN